MLFSHAELHSPSCLFKQPIGTANPKSFWKKSQCNLGQLASDLVMGMRWENEARKDQVKTRVSGRSAATGHQPCAVYHEVWSLQRGWQRVEERGFFLSTDIHAWSSRLMLFAVPLAKGRKSIPSILNKDRKMQHTVITFEACTFCCCMLLLVQLWLKELAWSISTSFSSAALFSGGFL